MISEPYFVYENERTASPALSNGGQYNTHQFKDGYPENSRRKRKHPEDDDDDYHPPGQKRVRDTHVAIHPLIDVEVTFQPSRRSSTRSRLQQQQQRNHTPASEVMEPDPQPPLIQEMSFVTEEEARLASSDLEDYEEIWKGELGNYVMETHKRQKQVDAWFSRWIIVSGQVCYRQHPTQIYYRNGIA